MPGYSNNRFQLVDRERFNRYVLCSRRIEETRFDISLGEALADAVVVDTQLLPVPGLRPPALGGLVVDYLDTVRGSWTGSTIPEAVTCSPSTSRSSQASASAVESPPQNRSTATMVSSDTADHLVAFGVLFTDRPLAVPWVVDDGCSGIRTPETAADATVRGLGEDAHAGVAPSVCESKSGLTGDVSIA